MEEAVEKLTTCTSSGMDWPYALAQLYEGPHHMPLYKEGHLGILPQRGVEETPVGRLANSKSANSLPPAHKSSIL